MNIVERLKNSLEYEYNLSFNDRKHLLEEIDRLNNIIKELSKDVDMWNKKYNEQFNIINELEKWLKKEHENGYEVYYLMAIQDILNKLKELKEE